MMLPRVCIGLVLLCGSAIAEKGPQSRVITDETPLSERLGGRSTDTDPFDPDHLQGPDLKKDGGARVELYLGVAAIGALLIYGFLRFQVQAAKRGE